MFKILFPTDFSLNAQKTLDHFCGWFANNKDVEIVIFHAIVPPKSVGGGFVSIATQMAKIAQQEMDAEVKRATGKFDLNIEGLCRAGFLQDCLDIAVKKMDADLTIMCSKGESDIESKVFGSNAEHCLRVANYPILVCPTVLPGKLQKLLYATEDGFLHGKLFLAKFIELFDESQVELQKLCVVKTEEELTKQFDQLEFMGKPVKLNVTFNKSALHGIEEWIEEHPADAIVINSKHKKWYDYLLNNSTTKKLAASIKLPILSLPNME